MDLLERAAASPPAAARADLDAALRAGGERIWVQRHVARLYATHVGDRDAAVRVLEGIAPLTVIEHRLAAAAWRDLDERDHAVRLLERAAKNARTAQDICNVALGYRDIGFEDEARLLVDGAARVATHAMDAWIVASCYRDAFLDDDRARVVLADGLRDAASVIDLLGFARAYAAHAMPAADLESIVSLAEIRASTVNDWIELSRVHHQLLRDAPRALASVSSASKLSVSPQDERAIAVARGHVQLELLDDERPKLPPSKLLALGARSFPWERDPNRLLTWLRTRIPRNRIDTLARPDRFLFNDDMVELLELQRSGNVPHPLPAYLDVLREYPAFDPDLRAFATSLLCIDNAARARPARTDTEMIALVESCLALGADAAASAAQLFAALADAYEATQSTTTVGELVLAAECGLALCAAWLDPTDPRIAPLVERLLLDRPDWPSWDISAWQPLAQRLLPRYAAQFGD